MLCPKCFRAVIKRSVKRFIAKLGMLRPGDRILVAYSLGRPERSLMLAEILLGIERAYGSSVAVMMPEDEARRLGLPAGDPLRSSGIKVERVASCVVRRLKAAGSRSFASMVRHEKALAVKYARLRGYGVVALPYGRLELASLYLCGFLRGSLAEALEGEDAYVAGEVRVLAPLSRLGPDEVAFYEHISGRSLTDTRCRAYVDDPLKSSATKLLVNMYWDSFETLFAIRESALLTAKLAAKLGYVRCPGCGSWIEKGRRCEVCSTVDEWLRPDGPRLAGSDPEPQA